MKVLREYELFSDRTQRLSERRQLASQTYLAVNTAILGVLALLVKDEGFRGWSLVLISIPLYLVGILVCIIWYRIIDQYRQIIGWHYEQLRNMEQMLPESRRIYTGEWEQFFRPRSGKEHFGFARLEAWMPRLLIGLYFIFSIGMIVATALGWL